MPIDRQKRRISFQTERFTWNVTSIVRPEEEEVDLLFECVTVFRDVYNPQAHSWYYSTLGTVDAHIQHCICN
jgi:hypothetical protein